MTAPEHLTVGTIRNYLPKRYSKMLKDYPHDSESLEFGGELQELWQMYEKDLDNHDKPMFQEITRFNSFAKMALLAWGNMPYEEFVNITSYKEFCKDYPALGKTIIVWAWS